MIRRRYIIIAQMDTFQWKQIHLNSEQEVRITSVISPSISASEISEISVKFSESFEVSDASSETDVNAAFKLFFVI